METTKVLQIDHGTVSNDLSYLKNWATENLHKQHLSAEITQGFSIYQLDLNLFSTSG
jgi:hypothetical protein